LVGEGNTLVVVGLINPSVGAVVGVGCPGFAVGVPVETGIGVVMAIGGSNAGFAGLSPRIKIFWSLITSAMISPFT
jgi:hypothetical protein